MDGTAGGPPPELIPGYYDNRSGLVIFCVTFCLFVATLMVSLRTWTRKVLINKMGPDDWVAIIALVITWGEGISIGIGTNYGLGKHIFAVQPPTLIPTYWKTFWVTLLLYHAGLCAAKLTFLLQYYRIFAIALPRMRIVYIAAIFIVGAWSFAQVLIALLICRPIQGLWDKTIEAECMPNAPQIYVNAGGNIITDVAIFLLPLPAIRHLTLQKRQKLVLLGIFSLGFFTVAISIIRIKFLEIGGDVTWQHVESSGWSIGELACAITCASLPTLRPFIAKYFPGLGFHSSALGSSNNQGQDPDSSASPSYKPPTIGGSGGLEREQNKMSSHSKKAGGGSSASSRRDLESYGDKMDEEEYELRESASRSTAAARRSGDIESITDEEVLLGMRPTTKTRIESRAPPMGVGRMDAGHGQDGHGQIQVMRDVYQSSTHGSERGYGR